MKKFSSSAFGQIIEMLAVTAFLALGVNSRAASDVINVNFGAHLSPGLDANKTSKAVIGPDSVNTWNFYSRDTHTVGAWRSDGAITGLLTADGGPTSVGLVVSNAPGSWANGSSDPMYNAYIYPFSGIATVSLTNLPAGLYDLYAYSQDGNYQVSVGTNLSAVKTTYDSAITNTTWEFGRQYTRFANLSVTNGEPVVLTVRPGIHGSAIISGLQIGPASGLPDPTQEPPVTNATPTITEQPAGATAFVGENVTLAVTAVGSAPLQYLWQREGRSIAGATGSSLSLSNIQPARAGHYTVRVTSGSNSVVSSKAPIVVVQVATNPLLNVTFDAHLTSGMGPIKTGFAALGQTTNDFWNIYSRDVNTSTGVTSRAHGTLPNLKFADGTTSTVGLTVLNLPGAGTNISTDAMYGTFLYPSPFTGSDAGTIALTNLPAGNYDLLIYSQDGRFQVASGNYNSIKFALDSQIVNPPTWLENQHYVRFTNVTVSSGNPLMLNVKVGRSAARISGLQLTRSTTVSNPPPVIPPTILTQPASQTVFAGATAEFSVAADGGWPLTYQWRRNGTNLAGATFATLTMSNVQPAQAGAYSVRITDTNSFIISSNALLTVLSSDQVVTNPLLNIDFVAHLSPGYAVKTGFAAIGATTNDFWNLYSRDIPNGTTPAPWQVDGAVTNLLLANQTSTTIGLVVSNAPGAWGNGSSDVMYAGYLYPFGGNATVMLTNLPASQYDLYVYSHDGNYQVSSANYLSPVRTSRDNPVSNPPAWQAGRQYALFTNVPVATGSPLVLTVANGVDGYAIISGLQLIPSSTTVSNPPNVPLAITSQPTNQTVQVGNITHFYVAATGPSPLSYQWLFNGTNISWATNPILIISNAEPAQAGNYSVRVSRGGATLYSSNAILTVLQNSTNPPSLTNASLNVTFGAHLSPGLNATKTGVAAVGQTPNDFWNFYSRDRSDGSWQVNGALTGLKLADGSATAAGLVVSNAPGSWGNGSSDPMYAAFIYPFNGVATVALTNLPPGQYDLYVYSHDGNYQVSAGNYTSPIQTTRDNPLSNPPVWQQGRQYTVFSGLSIPAGQPLKLSVNPGVDGYAVISGLQLVTSSSAVSNPPVAPALTITNQPVDETVFVGATAIFSVLGGGPGPLGYQWRHNGTNIFGATDNTLILTNVQLAHAGQYSVRLTNATDAITSSNAALVVVQATTNPLFNVTFGAHLSPGLDANKTGSAAWGQTSSDFWNFYSRDAGSNGGWQTDGALTGLKLADGASTTAGLVVSNAPGAWGNGLSDPMYGTYVYPFNGAATVMVTNLPAGQYDLYVYSHDGGYQVSVANYLSPVQTTRDVPLSNPPVWQEGRQYTRFTALNVSAGEPLALTVLPGMDGYAIISGLQLHQTTGNGGSGGTNMLGRLALSSSEKRVSFTATPAQRLRVQASIDLKQWLDVGTVLADDRGHCEFIDRDATKFPSRYYRVVP